ncbi:MAG TPA: NADPH-dependent glutamate synthase [Candidatus Omnitrophota bacterium]|nr:NADPH-dependent glutamate synthase [Candidatus Omnitrophota bacterium]HRZ66716.1 NADPH-dependent glutamate synthase [Candidatus Omnitrophota bacterium]
MAKISRQVLGCREPNERNKDFKEVALGFTEEQAVLEAQRCIACKKKPCCSGCPVEVDIPEFIKLIAKKDFRGAIQKIKEKNNLPAVCGRVCPQETQCEAVCTFAAKKESIAIGALERFVADWEAVNTGAGKASPAAQKNGIKVAVVGAGPAGLTAAADLARYGYKVTLFESLSNSGGVLRYGIPEFRLPKVILDRETEYIRSLGVEINYNILVGRTITIDDLFKDGYKAVFVGSGAGLPYFLGIPGENLNGVYSANEFLTRVNLMHAYEFPKYKTPVRIGERVAVVGAGNTAMDCVRVAKRLGAKEAMIVYRRSEHEAPARRAEVEHAKEEGIEFRFLTAPLSIEGNEKGEVKSMTCIKMELGEPDASGRRRPVPVKGSEYTMPVDTVVIAVGQGPNPLIPRTSKGIAVDQKSGELIIDENCMTSIKGVFAGGDITTGEGTVIAAMGAGKKAAAAMDRYLKGV